MNWTSEYPKQPGYYWIRNYRIDYPASQSALVPGPELVNVDDSYPESREYVYWVGDEVGIHRGWISTAEWYGPITPPEQENVH